MLRARPILTALAALSGCVAAAPAAPQPTDTLFVHNPKGTVLHVAPSATSQAVETVPMGAALNVRGENMGTEVVSGTTGGWFAAKSASGEGFVFDGDVGPMPPAPATCADFDAWTALLKVERPPAVVEQASCPDEFPDCDSAYTVTRTNFVGGPWTAKVSGYEYGATVIYMPHTSMEQAWWSVMRCESSVTPSAKDVALPTSNTTLPAGSSDSSPVEVAVSAEGVTLSWVEVESCSLEIRKKGHGVQVVESCGL